MKPTIWIFSLEPIESRYTAQWHDCFPELLINSLGDKFNIVQIDGIQNNSVPTPGAFLNFSDTNYWKSSQLCKFLEHYNNGDTSRNDHFIFTDAWNPVILQIKYMKDLLGLNWTLSGLWHAGSYDPADFLGRLIGNDPWVRHTEKALFHALDSNCFATDFHINLFCENLLGIDQCTAQKTYIESKKILRTGWPMEYMISTLENYKDLPKRDLILFPHRIAPEKQVEIFKDLAKQLPQYEFVICQDRQLTKHEYHTLLGQSKMVFSANLQETLGISCYEGAIVGSIPMVPDRLSYKEMYSDQFKYPSSWTESWESYMHNRDALCSHVVHTMEDYKFNSKQLTELVNSLSKDFFSANSFLENFKHV